MRRRDFLKSSATLVGTSLVIRSFYPTAVFAQDTPKPGGTLIWGHSETTQNMDIHQVGTASTLRVLENVHAPIVTIDKNLKVIPNLAESFEESEDGLTYTFHLSKDVKFHNGAPMTSADVKYSFERCKDPKTGAVNFEVFNDVASIETPDDATVVIKMSKVNAPFLARLAENGAGGLAMVEDGLITRFGIDEVYGMHNHPGLPVGSFSIRPGAFYAAVDNFTIDVTGKGAHAAKPHVGIDTTMVACHIVLALQSIASRNVDPIKSIVVSVTSFRTETEAHNVIPERVQLRGTMRTFDNELRRFGEERLKAIATTTAAAYGATAAVTWEALYPVMVNAETETSFAAAAAERVSGKPVADAAAIMGGEDFAYMLEACPGAYIQVGNGDTADVHHPKYNFNDEAIPAGTSYWAELVESRLPVP